jgi:hypothetical protein
VLLHHPAEEGPDLDPPGREGVPCFRGAGSRRQAAPVAPPEGP